MGTLANVRGGRKFEQALRDIARRLNKGALQVGFMENAIYPDGKKVAMIAAIQEFGAPGAGIPPRPFFRNMIAAKSAEWPEAIAKTLIKSKYDVNLTLNRVGEAIKGQLQQSIRDLTSPPLKPATIIRKGGTAGMVFNPKKRSTFPAKPLIDTGHMLDSVTYRIKKT